MANLRQINSELKNIENVTLVEFLRDLNFTLGSRQTEHISFITEYGRVCFIPKQNGKYEICLQQAQVPGDGYYEIGTKEITMWE